MFYVLNEDGSTRRTEDLREWGEAFEGASRVISLDVNRRYTVSTVFLGLDHGRAGGAPLLFETMVFLRHHGSPADEWACERYPTIEAARAGHERMLRRWRWYYWCLPAVVAWERLRRVTQRVLHALRG